MDLKANFKSEMAKVCWAIDKAQWYFWKEKCETVPANCINLFSCSQIDCPFLNFKFVYTKARRRDQLLVSKRSQS